MGNTGIQLDLIRDQIGATIRQAGVVTSLPEQFSGPKNIPGFFLAILFTAWPKVSQMNRFRISIRVGRNPPANLFFFIYKQFNFFVMLD